MKDLWAAVKPSQKTKSLTRELTQYIADLRAKWEPFIKRLTEVLDTLTKLDAGDFMNMNFYRLTEALTFKGWEGKPELEVEENTEFFKRLQLITQKITIVPTGIDALPIDPSLPPTGDAVKVEWRKKTPEIDERIAQTMEMFLASKIEVRTFKGTNKWDIVSPLELAIKYSEKSVFKVVFQGGHKRILFKIKYSLTPKKEVLQFYLLPKSQLEFASSPEVNADEIKAISFLRLETYYFKNTKQVHDKGMIFVFEQSKQRFLLLMNDKVIAQESRVKLDETEEYLLVMSVTAADPNNMYFYIENKYVYKPN